MIRNLLISLLLITSLAKCQQFPNPYQPSFHSAPGNLTVFQFDIANPQFIDSTMTHQVFYRDSVATTWASAAMTQLYQTCTTYTFSGSINYVAPSSALEYYFRSEGDTAVVSMSPKNAANSFPVPAYLMADMGADPTGDATGATGSYLDLTGMQMSYSDTKIYARITNAGGGFPTNSGLTFFLYGVGIISPDAGDSIGYAMVYINVPFLMSAGLYKINAADTSFAKIASISTNVTGNALSMSCNISDLTSQPGFGPWPPVSGFILTAPLTATQTTSGFTTNDVGKGGVFVPASHYLRFGLPNTAPALTSLSVTASQTGEVSASVTYSDANNDLPTLREFVFNSQHLPMVACEKNYAAGSIFTTDLTEANSGWFPYYFRFSDGKDTVTTGIDSVYVGSFVPGDADGSGGIDVSDVVFIIAYIFSGGAAPNPPAAGDANCDLSVDISDAVYLITYIFSGGPAPCN